MSEQGRAGRETFAFLPPKEKRRPPLQGQKEGPYPTIPMTSTGGREVVPPRREAAMKKDMQRIAWGLVREEGAS